VHRGALIVGNNGDGNLKKVDLETKEISTIIALGAGIIDGVETDGDGNYLVSHWEGRLYRITPDGRKEKLLDTTAPEINCANFAFVPEENLLLVPTFFDNRIFAYKLKE
jgi:sugar lactone lactonase YvrE